jgi:AraC-like DNA-binding protein
MTAALFFLTVDVASIVCSALFGARVIVKQPRLVTARLILLVTVDNICHILLSRYEYRHWIPDPYQFELGSVAQVLNLARNLTPGLFMMLCFAMFADSTRFPRWLMGLFVLEIVLELPMRGLFDSVQLSYIATRVTPGVLQGVFAGFAIYWTVASWRSDLIEIRRRARAIIGVIIGLDIIGESVLLRVLIPQGSIANYHVHLALVTVNLLILAFMLIFLGDEDLHGSLSEAGDPVRPDVLPAVDSPESTTILTQLARLMEVERVYRQPSLSLKELADLVGAPEYRLRKIIHEQLGYPNFNVFLHNYRIRDACQQIRDPKQRRIPILTIALSTGYQSINTFNRGFREIMDMTPSAYRALEEAPVPAEVKKI